MDKIYLVITSGGSYEDRWKQIKQAFYTKEKAEQFKDDYNKKLQKLQYIEEQKEKHRKSFDYELVYETYNAVIEEVNIE